MNQILSAANVFHPLINLSVRLWDQIFSRIEDGKDQICILWREAIPQERQDFYQTMLVYKILFYFPIKHVVKLSKPDRTHWLTTECYQHSFYNWEKYLNHQRETSSNTGCLCWHTPDWLLSHHVMRLSTNQSRDHSWLDNKSSAVERRPGGR